MSDAQSKLSAAGVLLRRMSDLSDELMEGRRSVEQIRGDAALVRQQWRDLIKEINLVPESASSETSAAQ